MYDFTTNYCSDLLAKRGTLHKRTIGTHTFTSTFHGEDAWTDGHMFALGTVPKTLKNCDWQPLTAKTNETLDALYDAVKADSDAQPIAYADSESLADPIVIIATEDRHAWEAVNAHYAGFFCKNFKNVTFALNTLIAGKAVVVRSNGQPVGLIMPLNMANSSDSFAELLADYDIPSARRTFASTCDMQYHEGAACKWQPVRKSMWIRNEDGSLGSLHPDFIRDMENVKKMRDAAAAAYVREQAPAPAMHGPAFVPKPRVRWSWVGYCSPWQPRPVEVPQVVKMPTPITRTPRYTPRVGDTVFIVVRHENGTTTDRVVNITRVANDGHAFRGFDRRYNRVRNFSAEHIAHIELWDGGTLYDAEGREVTLAA